MADGDKKTPKGRWKKGFEFTTEDFSLFREDFSTKRLWYEYKGIKKVDEYYLTYAYDDIFTETIEEFQIDIHDKAKKLMTEGLENAHEYEFGIISDVIDAYIERLHRYPYYLGEPLGVFTTWQFEFNHWTNVMLIPILEYYLSVKKHRIKSQTLTNIEHIFEIVKENWEVDLEVNLADFVNYYCERVSVDPSVINDFFTFFDIDVDYESLN